MVSDSRRFGGDNLWVPYSGLGVYSSLPIRVVAGDGCYLELEDGRRLLDGISSWWTVCHGYSHPHIVGKMREQLERLCHVMLCKDLVHEGAYELASRLIKVVPGGLERVFFSDSGSMAVEVAMKIAVRYWHALGKTQKNSFVFFRNAYHGDSMGCMSVSDPNAIHGLEFASYYPEQYVFDLPQNEDELSLLQERVESIKHKVAAVVLEPILQAAGGMKIHSSGVLASIKKLAEDNDVLFIADEVATGFGRTSTMFACEQASIVPDIMVLGKAISGGMCSLAATLVANWVCDPFRSDIVKLMHGNTFMASPLACAAANASLDLFEDGSLLARLPALEAQLKVELDKLRDLNYVHNLRVKGAVAAIDMDYEHFTLLYKDLTEKLLNLGIWIRPIGSTVYLMPPLVISSDELSQLNYSLCELISGCSETVKVFMSVPSTRAGFLV